MFLIKLRNGKSTRLFKLVHFQIQMNNFCLFLPDRNVSIAIKIPSRWFRRRWMRWSDRWVNWRFHRRPAGYPTIRGFLWGSRWFKLSVHFRVRVQIVLLKCWNKYFFVRITIDTNNYSTLSEKNILVKKWKTLVGSKRPWINDKFFEKKIRLIFRLKFAVFTLYSI